MSFAYLNLAEDVYPSLATQTNAMDLILCRNVLMYFSAGQARKVLQNLAKSLKENGWLIVSLTETSIVRFSPLVTVNFPEATVYRKDSGAKQIEPGAVCPTFQPAQRDDPRTARPDFPRLQGRPLVQPTWPRSVAETSTPVPELPGRGAKTPDMGEEPCSERVEELVALARNCANLGDLTAALSWCEQLVAADRLNPAWHYLRAAILQEQDAVAEAALSLRKAIYLDQDFIMAHFALGNLALRQGNARGARKHFDNVLALLDSYQPDEPLPESEGITAGRLKEIVFSTIAAGNWVKEKPPLSSAAGGDPKEMQRILQVRAKALAQAPEAGAESENHLEAPEFSLAYERTPWKPPWREKSSP